MKPQLVLGLAMCMVFAGCFSDNGGSRVSSSGDPAADRRAALKIGGSDKGGEIGTLYERLGGRARITELVNDVTQRVIADPRVNFERKDVTTSWTGSKYKAWQPTPEHLDQFKQHMVEFVVVATGGTSEYTGREIKTVHKGMRITNQEFDAMVGDVKASMEKMGYKAREIRDFIAIIETTRKQIVEKA